MKKFAIAGIIMIAIIAAVAFVANRSSDDTASLTPTPSSEYRLVVIADSVSLTRTGKTSPEKVTGTTTVAQGDRISTSATGRARLRWPNGTVTTLEEDTQITLEKLADEGFASRIELIAGDIWSKVGRVLGTDQYYEVQTQDTVAAVRGTVFRFSYRNRQARIEGIESTVRVSLRTKEGKTDTTTGVDITEDSVAEFDETITAPSERRIKRRILTALEKEERIHRRIRREMNRVDKDEAIDREDIRKGDLLNTTVLPSVTLKPSVSVRPSPTPSVAVSPRPSPTPSPTPTATVAPTLTPLPPVSIDHTFPKIISSGNTFSLEGANYVAGRNTSRIKSIAVGDKPASFSIVAVDSVFVTPGSLPAGVYDISLVTTDGQTLTLKAAITIQ